MDIYDFLLDVEKQEHNHICTHKPYMEFTEGKQTGNYEST